VIDSVQGEVRFGPLIREPSGLERQFGARPEAGGVIRMISYRTGGGTAGNVGDNTITLLKTAVPRIDRVTNRRPARDGLDTETLDHAMLRAPRELRSSSRAVVAEDFEHFARKSSRYVARARCLQPPTMAKADQQRKAPQPGQVRVLIVPQVHEPARRLDIRELQISDELRAQVQAYLDERRLLTTFVTVEAPDYIPVSVVARLRAAHTADARALVAEAERRLHSFLNPLVGGPDGEGWQFGRNLNLAAVFSLLQTITGVAEIIEIQLMEPNTKTPQSTIQVADDALIVSGAHRIEVLG
jgi:predicted phage baseplate assembly protein